VIYDVRHLTRYHYGAPVAVNACVLRLLPRSEDGQRVVTAQIDVTPRPQTFVERADSFANRVVRMRIETPHRELAIESRARVVIERPAPPLAALTPPWEDVAALAAATDSLSADSPARLGDLSEPARSAHRAGDVLRARKLPAAPPDLRGGERTRRAHQGRLRLRREGDRGDDFAR
jgi:transglutaminase-like putative cysteine protease